MPGLFNPMFKTLYIFAASILIIFNFAIWFAIFKHISLAAGLIAGAIGALLLVITIAILRSGKL